MYANAPHASAASVPLSPLSSAQAIPGQAQHGQPQGMPPAALSGGPHGMGITAQVRAYSPPAAAPINTRSRAASVITGAYQSSGDAAIDRMLRLEAACKRFGSPL